MIAMLAGAMNIIPDAFQSQGKLFPTQKKQKKRGNWMVVLVVTVKQKILKMIQLRKFLVPIKKNYRRAVNSTSSAKQVKMNQAVKAVVEKSQAMDLSVWNLEAPLYGQSFVFGICRL